MSRIEQIIEEMEEYLEGCKNPMFSTSKIVVDKEEMLELLAELRLRTPEEIKKYQKIVANRDSILDEAKKQAAEIVNQANIHTNAAHTCFIEKTHIILIGKLCKFASVCSYNSFI